MAVFKNDQQGHDGAQAGWRPRLRRLLLLAILLLPRVPGAQPAVTAPELDTLEQRLAPCAACHGEEGRGQTGGYYPRLAGKPAGYLYNQLLNFREGRRQHAVMMYLVDRQRPQYLREMAAHFASRAIPYPPPAVLDVPDTLLARGRRLVEQGQPEAGIPACAACHGASLTGAGETIPGLIGLPRDYLSAQLGAWQAGLRRAQAPDCMGTIARRLSLADITAVSAFLATRTAPAEVKAGALPARLPLHCGGVEPAETGS